MSISKEEQIITVFLQRFNRIFIPRLQQIEEKLDRGEELEQAELRFLEQVLTATSDILPKIITNREYNRVFVDAIFYYSSITTRALNNAQGKTPNEPNSVKGSS